MYSQPRSMGYTPELQYALVRAVTVEPVAAATSFACWGSMVSRVIVVDGIENIVNVWRECVAAGVVKGGGEGEEGKRMSRWERLTESSGRDGFPPVRHISRPQSPYQITSISSRDLPTPGTRTRGPTRAFKLEFTQHPRTVFRILQRLQ